MDRNPMDSQPCMKRDDFFCGRIQPKRHTKRKYKCLTKKPNIDDNFSTTSMELVSQSESNTTPATTPDTTPDNYSNGEP